MFQGDVDADAFSPGTTLWNHLFREMKEFKLCKQINGMLKYHVKHKIKGLEAAWTTKYKSLAGCSAIVKSL